jgi:predicted nucleic acid-binding protein
MYAGGAEHPLRHPCRQLLEKVAAGEVRAAISTEVIQEILHRFRPSAAPVIGERMARAALDLFAPVLPITHRTMERALRLAASHPQLSSRDCTHAAVCQEEGITAIVSPDRGFDVVGALTRVDPAEPLPN